MKFVTDLRKVGGLLRVRWFMVRLTAMITEILLKVALNTIIITLTLYWLTSWNTHISGFESPWRVGLLEFIVTLISFVIYSVIYPYNIPTKRVGLVQNVHHHHHIEMWLVPAITKLNYCSFGAKLHSLTRSKNIISIEYTFLLHTACINLNQTTIRTWYRWSHY
jgi:hypothetical protein